MAKKKKKSTDSRDSLNLIKKAIRNKYGDVISRLSDHEDMVIQTVSTGSISLDVALGRGGMALGRIYEIYGPNSGGKSTLGANIIIQGQSRGMKCLYVDAEHAVDPVLFKSYGVKTKELELVQGYNGEENLDILEMLITSGEYRIAVVDSVSSLIPSKEAGAEIGEDHIALLARLMSAATRRITPIANRANCLVIFINQLRMKVGGYGNPETTTGGEALPFYATGRISVRGPEVKARRIVDENGEVIGHKTLFEVVKNKLAPPFRKAEINLIYGKGYDLHWETLDLAVDLGIIDKSKSWYKYDGKTFANGEMNAVANLKENKELYEEIRNKIINMLDMNQYYEQASQ